MVQSSLGLALALNALLVLWEGLYLVVGAVGVEYAMEYEACPCIVQETIGLEESDSAEMDEAGKGALPGNMQRRRRCSSKEGKGSK